MHNKLLKYNILSLFSLIYPLISAQDTPVSGIINDYQRIEYINTDTVKVPDASAFSPGDKAMIIQMTGAVLDGDENITDAVVASVGNAGKYEILIIDTVLYPNNKVVFTNEVERTYTTTEIVQLIRIPEYERAVVNGTLKAKDWDGTTGGVLVFIANEKVTLNADIDVSGQGFQGGNPDVLPEYTGGCYTDNITYDSLYAHLSNQFTAFKGEGITQISYKRLKGRGANANGGGGGIGKYTGGAGGSNIVLGGKGGYEYAGCTVVGTISAQRGIIDINESEFFTNSGKRLILGGGGGTSTQNTSQGFYATKGGNGGGIVLILTDTLEGNNHFIKANGGSVTDTATAGAGGGGGGGSILLAVNQYSNNVNLHVNGGNGGFTQGLPATGPGGGGGIGVIRFATSPPASVYSNIENNPGLWGVNIDIVNPLDRPHGAASAESSRSGFNNTDLNMILSLTGFLFNTIFNDQVICEGELPAPITGTMPRGGNGIYTYQWQMKTKLTGWTDIATNAEDSLRYQPPLPLIDTTFYRRIVTSAGINDTSKVITVFVHDKILGNNISPDNQVICSSQAPLGYTGAGYTGGDNVSYDFQWQSSADNVNFTNIPLANNETYSPGILTQTLHYRRQIGSGICLSYSDTANVVVQPPVSGNNIADDQDVCYNLSPQPLTGAGPFTGGDGTTYNSLWQQSSNNITFIDASGTNNQLAYSPGNLINTAYYRRKITSGLCEDYSDTVEIIVLDSIINNSISKNDTLCQGNSITLTGLTPQNGDGNYSYIWIGGTSLNSLSDLSTTTTNTPFNSGALNSNRYFRRVIHSGRNNACIDTSDYVFIRVWNSIAGNTVAAAQEICVQTTPANLTGGSVSGGNGTNYFYQWQIKPVSGAWQPMQGTNNQPGYNFAYKPTASTYYIRRNVVSDVCSDNSDSIILKVNPLIQQNTISQAGAVCYNTSPGIFNSLTLSGGNGSYGYEWRESDDSLSYTPAAGTNDIYNYQVPNLQIPMFYYRIVTSGGCIDTSNIHKFSIYSLPTASIINRTDTLCALQPFNIAVTLSGQSPWDIYFNNENSVETIVPVHQPLDNIVVNPAGSYNFVISRVIDGNNCEATDITGVNGLYVYQYPVIDAGDDTEICGLTFTLNASATYPAFWEYNSSEIDLTSNSDLDADVTSQNYGVRKLYLHVLNWECESVDTLALTFEEQPVFIDAGEDMKVSNKQSTELNAAEPTIGIGWWNSVDPLPVITDSLKTDSEVTNLTEKKDYILIWTVQNGVCAILQDSIILTVEPLTPPNGISPNGDGVNDYFVIRGLDAINPNSKKELKIVNRWGQEVYYKEYYNNEWNGINKNGEDLPEGTYFYIFKWEGEKHEAGYVIIKR